MKIKMIIKPLKWGFVEQKKIYNRDFETAVNQFLKKDGVTMDVGEKWFVTNQNEHIAYIQYFEYKKKIVDGKTVYETTRYEGDCGE